MRLRSLASFVLGVIQCAPLAAQASDPIPSTSKTAHYALRVEGDRLDATELGSMLEQAWPVLQGFFKAEPALARDERLSLRVHATHDRWLDALLTEHASPPSHARLAWFAPNTRTVHVERQASDYVTRALVIYGACIQFHFLAKPKNRDLDAWYVHGLAESFATHAWDGEKLKLGISPRICAIDHPALALEALGGERFGLDAWTPERLQSPYVRWCAVRFALQGAEGKYRPRLEKLALGHTGSKLSGEDFMRSLGREKDIASEFFQWLTSVQMPFEVISGDFEDLTDGRVIARPIGGPLAIACARERFDELDVKYDPPRDRAVTVALVLRATGTEQYTLLRVEGQSALLEHYTRGERIQAEAFPLSALGKAPIPITARRDGKTVTVQIDGQPFGPFTVDAPRLGIAVLGGSTMFRDLDVR
jgi:hypothetical protein